MLRDGRPLSRFGELPEVHELTLTLPQLPPEWDGLRIAQVSDVHAGPYMPAARMQRIRDQVMQLEPDLVVFTGDQLDRRPDDARRFISGFEGIDAPLGVYGVLGNHDHQAGSSIATSAMEAAGIRPLVNETAVLARGSARLAIAGVDDVSAPFPHRPDFSILHRHPDAYRLCLCHQPRAWPDADAAGAHLTLSGHTHGGQIALTRRNINVARLQGRFIVGPYRREDSFLFVSRGVGVGAVPVRFGAPSEVDLLTLRSERTVTAELEDEAAA
jgi:predicted MPP superfamily phosphohydrolase